MKQLLAHMASAWFALLLRGSSAKQQILALVASTVFITAVAFNGFPATAQSNELRVLYERYLKNQKAARYQESERIAKRMLAISAKHYGKDNTLYADYLMNLAITYMFQARHTEAIALFEQALAITERKVGREHKDLAYILNNLALTYGKTGRFSDAIRLYKRTLEIEEKANGLEHKSVADTLNNLAVVYNKIGRYADLIPLYERAIAIYEKTLGDQHPSLADALNNLAIAYRDLGKSEQALSTFERALGIFRKSLGSRHPAVADVLSNLASVHNAQRKHAKTIPLLRQALSIHKKTFGPAHPTYASTLGNLASAYHGNGQHAQAISLFKQSLKIKEKVFDPNHRTIAITLDRLARAHHESLQYREAFSYARRAARILGSGRPGTNASLLASGTRQKKHQVRINSRLVRIAYDYVPKDQTQRSLMIDEAFTAAQRFTKTSTSGALSQMAARFSARDDNLGKLVREHQDLETKWQELDKNLTKALSQPPGKRDRNAERKFRQDLASTEKRMRVLASRLSANHPQFAELANPKPLTGKNTQGLLGADETLISYVVLDDETYVWAVDQDNVVWKRVGRNKEYFEKHITDLRTTLDPVAASASQGRGLSREKVCRDLRRETDPCKAYDTDLAIAHDLYKDLLGAIEPMIVGKKHIIIVPSGPLTALPFNMLVTQTPPRGSTRIARYRRAQWLIRRHAVTILPSVASLKALRIGARKSQAKRPFIGIGNPNFSKPREKKNDRRNVETTRGYSTYFRDGLADVNALSGAIPPLPDTADELRAVGKVLKASRNEILLGRQASETVIKRLSAKGQLDDYGIVHFATHGLIAGEIKGLAEPALALSFPNKATILDDSLLTASEVAQLKLNADWVVLSACNTAAGNAPGAEAFSGLARAFFYAGSRAILVSHWPVVSEAAVKLTTRAFDLMQADPTIGRAEALRRSMLALIDKGARYEAHPAYWAPFIVVGEGGVYEADTKNRREKPVDPDALYTLGMNLLNGEGVTQDLVKGRKTLEQAAKNGHSDAMHVVGVVHQRGFGVPKDGSKAVEWYEKAARAGHTLAMYRLGLAYKHADGVNEDFDKALFWIEKAANNGNLDAMGLAGIMYLHGGGTTRQDHQLAIKWIESAAAGGLPAAMWKLGQFHEDGWGRPKNLKEAKAWYKKSADKGFKHAIDALKRLK